MLPGECRDDFGQKIRSSSNKTSLDKWRAFQNCVKQHSNKKVRLSSHLIDEVMFQYVYPRLDLEVTKGMNHLLKSPFCVHPKTGRVCVPIEAEKCEQFSPGKVPMIDELCAQLERCDLINMDKKIKDWKKTDMKGAIEIFEGFIKNLEKTWKGNNLLQSDLKGA